jgi:tRNA-specific 2-thiouridylase
MMSGNEISLPPAGTHVVVAMSGGVDSSVTAALLQRQGCRVEGVTMRLFPFVAAPGKIDPAIDARRVADQLGIPHQTIDLTSEFQRCVQAEFIAEYRMGRTPNPCARCNQQIKFGQLLRWALDRGADYLATGHYARVACDGDGRAHLLAGSNSAKDQSYFLFSLGQQELRRVLFPLGTLRKEEVRVLATQFHLSVADKGDSQEICFIPDDDYVRFLEESGGGGEGGEIIDRKGRVLGHHHGIHRYTIGQRRGLGIAYSEPLYVVAIDAEKQQVVVGTRSELLTGGLMASQVSWIIPPLSTTFEATCKIRYRHRPIPCTVTILQGGEMTVRFAQPEAGVTPGQVAAIYQGDELLGGGWIDGRV